MVRGGQVTVQDLKMCEDCSHHLLIPSSVPSLPHLTSPRLTSQTKPPRKFAESIITQAAKEKPPSISITPVSPRDHRFHAAKLKIHPSV
jgi:hypothetical protein